MIEASATTPTQTEEADSAGEGRLLDVFAEAAHAGQKGIASLFIDAYQDRFIYDHVGDQWYEFSGSSWQPLLKCQQIHALTPIQEDYLQPAMFAIQEELKQITEEHDAKDAGDISPNDAETYKKTLKTLQGNEKALFGAIQNLNSLTYRKVVCEFAATGEEGLSITSDQFDTNPWLIACDNGVINLKTGGLREGRPDDYIRRAAPAEYRSDAKCPGFLKFLSEVFDGDLETVAYVQRALGMALIGDSDLKQVIFIFSGRGRNGKTSLLDTISDVLGPQLCSKISSETLLSSKYGKSSGSATPEIMGLQGLRLAYASETNEGKAFDTAKIKELTGGGYLRGRGVYAKHEITFKSSHMLILDTNHKPIADAADYAFWQRVKCIDFPLSFVNDPKKDFERLKDPSLKARLTEEREGILAWLVRGCLEFQAHGLDDPQSVKDAAIQYRDSVDLIGQFLSDRCNTSAIGRGSSSMDLYNAYKFWCVDAGTHPFSLQRFGRYMSDRFPNEHTREGKVFPGVVLR